MPKKNKGQIKHHQADLIATNAEVGYNTIKNTMSAGARWQTWQDVLEEGGLRNALR